MAGWADTNPVPTPTPAPAPSPAPKQGGGWVNAAPAAAPASGFNLGSAIEGLINKLPGDHPRPLPSGFVGDNRPLVQSNRLAGTIYNATMQRPTDAAYAARYGGQNYFSSLWNGVDPDQAALNATKAYHAGGIDEQSLSGLGPLARPVSRVAQGLLDTAVNPVNLLSLPAGGGRTIAGKIIAAGEEHALPAIVKGADKVAAKIKTPPPPVAPPSNAVKPGVVPKVEPPPQSIGDKIVGAVSGAHDFLGVDSAAKRELMRTVGPKWVDQYARLRALKMSGLPADKLEAQINETLAGIPEGADRDAFVKALARADQGMSFSSSRVSTPTQPKLDPNRLVEQTPLFPGQSGVGFHPPGVESHGPAGAAPVSRPSVLGPDPAKVSEMAKNVAGRMGALAPEDQRILDMINKPGWQPWQVSHAANIPSDVLKGAMFYQPFGHGGNVFAHGMAVDPGATLKALGIGAVNTVRQLPGTGTKILKSLGVEKELPNVFGAPETAEARAARFSPSQEAGGLSTHSDEIVNPLSQGLGAAGDVAGKIPGRAGKVAKTVASIPGALYNASSDALWGFENEVRHQRVQSLVASGMSPERAGLKVASEMVDYNAKSPFAKSVAPVVPFNVWRTQNPGVTARNALENPARTQFYSSLFPGWYGGTEPGDDGQNYTTSHPGSELNQALTKPGEYAAGSVGSAARVAGDVAGYLNTLKSHNAETQKKARTQFTYGKEVPEFVLNQLFPWLQYTGSGMFNRGEAPSAADSVKNAILGTRKTR